MYWRFVSDGEGLVVSRFRIRLTRTDVQRELWYFVCGQIILSATSRKYSKVFDSLHFCVCESLFSRNLLISKLCISFVFETWTIIENRYYREPQFSRTWVSRTEFREPVFDNLGYELFETFFTRKSDFFRRLFRPKIPSTHFAVSDEFSEVVVPFWPLFTE